MTTSCVVIFINNYDAKYPMVIFPCLQSCKIFTLLTCIFLMRSWPGLKENRGMFLPCGVSSASDWLPGYGHRVLAPVLWPIRSQNSGQLWNSYWWGSRRCHAVLGLYSPIGMLYLVLITLLHIHKTKNHVCNSNKRRFPLKWQNLTALFPKKC